MPNHQRAREPAGADAALIRKAFVMAVIPGKADEYAQRHSQFWPELGAALKAHGAHNYSIFYYPTTRHVFTYVEIEDEARWTAFASTEICKKWREHMSEIMPSNADKSPACANLSEVFHLD